MAGEAPNKKHFFQALDLLESPDKDAQNEEDARLELLISGSRGHSLSKSTASRRPNPVKLPRANSDPQPSSTDQELPRIGISHENISSRPTDPKVPRVKRSATTGTMSGTKIGGPAAKKRRVSSVKSIPAEQQIFKDLVFYFFPNNDISPLRRLRIQRAQEYGAQRASEWGANVTHVIVDKGLTFHDLLTHLKLESFPVNVIVVDECYPSDCIRFRSVLSPSHARFHVGGTPGLIEDQGPPAVGEPTIPGSLPLKLSKRERAQLPEPSHMHDSGGNSPVVRSSPAAVTEQVQQSDISTALRERDLLDDLIEEAKATRHLPLDPLDFPDDEPTAETSDAESRESDYELDKQQPNVSQDKAAESWTKNFSCMQKYEPNLRTHNPNNRTIEVLQQMLDYYTRTADHWRVLAYRKAINALRRQPKTIVTRTQALSVPGIGTRLADKIEEIVLTNRLRRLDNTSSTTEDLIIQEFLGVYGAGLSQASKWVAQGYRSLCDLREKASLTKNQRIGVERYHDFAQRIPRKEVEAHGEIVRRAVQQVDPDILVTIMGSYRRGTLDSGDIDLMITKPEATLEQIRTLMINTVVPQLFQDGFLQVGLATTSRQDGSKWHGASTIPGSNTWRRLDLLFVPGDEIGAALIYFTGNDIFNRSMRLLARKKGMCLNQKGLYTDVLRNGQAKLNSGRLVESRDEQRIFATLGVPWRPPEHRIC
ncbi:hypothetical protein N7474_000557 [Penicillium riverlandense]|uniref:uncharacterized protein n=1 Tax=Penicillium riverlandense TaxID=1903569 RepID=UPI002548DB70|nr:uncharacterized protein N7474_000557 [Penicillium riverlandense]KAJ5832246.1 hypothetical protein N7474_000557 [Penicillium riverlandense]